jgi:hypothetical protein
MPDIAWIAGAVVLRGGLFAGEPNQG